MSVMCAWASIGENGKVTGGKAGDQTGKEVKCGSIYNFGQTEVYRCKERPAALRIGAAAKAIAINDAFGYNQLLRTTAYRELENAGWVVADIKRMCSIDCSQLGACAVNVAYGKPLISSAVYSGNIGAALLATKHFTKLTASKYMGVSEHIQCGDIIVAPGKHVIVAYTDGSKVNITSSTPATDGNAVIKLGQQHAITFTGVKIPADGIAGPQTTAMKARVLQHAINEDYHAKLVEDGLFGSNSKKALGTHYIKKGEKQYMVTAAEILMELNGISPNGVEYPGIYGNGLVEASKKKFGGDGLKINASGFLRLI